MKPRTLILRTAGTNCDGESAHAFELAGSDVTLLHINRLLEQRRLMEEFQILAIPGGFSYGDDIAAGRIFANQIAHHLSDAFRDFVTAGKPIIGVCNGFQVLVKTELLPGPLAGMTGQNCTLTNNDCGRFIDRWLNLLPRSRKCIWTAELDPARPLAMPIAHGEGKFVPANDAVRRALWDQDQVALVYATPAGEPAAGSFPDNPNGSTDDIAGVCDATGLVFGLMPHPERYVTPLQHPAWARQRAEGILPGSGDGLAIFANAVRHVRDAVGTGV
jgi:phosphoribosylformylglycinamidine synthase I